VAKVDIYKKRSMDADIVVSSAKFVVAPKMSFEVKAEFDNKVFALVSKDDILLSAMNKACAQVYDDLCEQIRTKVAAFDKLVVGMVEKGSPLATIEKQLDGVNAAIEKDKSVAERAAENAVGDVWKAYAKKQKEYASYKVEIVFNVVGSVAGLATSLAGMATTPFTGGASAALAIIGMIKSAVEIVRELASAWQEVETSIDLLKPQLEVLEKVTKTTLGRKANEYTAAVSTQFFGVAQPSIKSCKNHLETAQSKLKGVEIKLHEATVKINDILDKQDDLKKEFMKSVASRLDAHPGAKAKSQRGEIEAELDRYLGKSRSDFIKQKDAISDMNKRFVTVQAELDGMAKRVEEIAAKRDLDERLLRAILTIVDTPIQVGSILQQGKKAVADLASDLAPNAAFFVYEKVKDKVLKDTYLEA